MKLVDKKTSTPRLCEINYVHCMSSTSNLATIRVCRPIFVIVYQKFKTYIHI